MHTPKFSWAQVVRGVVVVESTALPMAPVSHVASLTTQNLDKVGFGGEDPETPTEQCPFAEPSQCAVSSLPLATKVQRPFVSDRLYPN